MDLNSQVKKLEEDLNEKSQTIRELAEQKDLAFENCPIVIHYHYYIHSGRNSSTRHEGELNTSLEELFSIISTEMMDVMILEKTVEDSIILWLPISGSSRFLSDSQFVKKILNQYKELGLMYSNWNNENRQLYWGLTAKGQKKRNDIILIRKKESASVIQ